MDEGGQRLASRRLPEGLDGIRMFHELVAGHVDDLTKVVVGIETDRGLWDTAVGIPLARSLSLALITTVISTLLGLLSALAFRKRFRGRDFLFYSTLLAAIVPGLTLGLGITLLAQELDFGLGIFSTGLLSHLIWTHPFSFVILVITFNRFDTTIEEAAAVLGATR